MLIDLYVIFYWVRVRINVPGHAKSLIIIFFSVPLKPRPRPRIICLPFSLTLNCKSCQGGRDAKGFINNHNSDRISVLSFQEFQTCE